MVINDPFAASVSIVSRIVHASRPLERSYDAPEARDRGVGPNFHRPGTGGLRSEHPFSTYQAE